jgi:ubiquinol-cytochrome c reductase cytochrome c1 subunit
MAKDVTTFLAWASEPEHDERKKMGFRAMLLLASMTALMYWWKRSTWSYLKSRKIVVLPFKKK